MSDLTPDIVHMLEMWPLWKDDRLMINDVTLSEYELISAFGSGYDKWMSDQKGSRKGPSAGAEEMGKLPKDLRRSFGLR